MKLYHKTTTQVSVTGRFFR